MKLVLFDDDLLQELIKYLDSKHAAFLMRIDKSQREELDKDLFRRMVQKKKSEEEMKKELIVSAGKNNSVKVQDIEGKFLKELKGHSGIVYSASFNQNGSLTVSASFDKSIRIWDALTGECLKILEGHSQQVYSAEFNQDSSLIVSASQDRSIRIWDALTGECLKILEGHSDQVYSASFNQNGSLIVSASADKLIRIWDVKTGECLKILEGHSGLVYSAEFNQDSSLIVSAGDDKQIRIWDAQTGECLKILEGHSDFVNSASFNQNGSLIVSAGDDKAIRIWDVKTGECIKNLHGNSDSDPIHIFNSAKFNQNGTLIVSVIYDKEIRIWDAQSGFCLKVINERSYQVSFKKTFLIPKVQDSINDLVELLEKKGNDLLRNNLIKQAIMKYIESLALFKDVTTSLAKKKRSLILSNIALCYLKLDNNYESLQYAERAILTDISNTQAQQHICKSLYNLKRFEEANERVNIFLTSDPENNDLKIMKNKIIYHIENHKA